MCHAAVINLLPAPSLPSPSLLPPFSPSWKMKSRRPSSLGWALDGVRWRWHGLRGRWCDGPGPSARPMRIASHGARATFSRSLALFGRHSIFKALLQLELIPAISLSTAARADDSLIQLLRLDSADISLGFLLGWFGLGPRTRIGLVPIAELSFAATL